MKTTLEIKKASKKPFTTSEGEQMDYFWYRGLRKNDGVTIDFGSTQEYGVGDEVEIELEKGERIDKNGKTKITYKEINAKLSV